jgi:hypothetical protein
MCYSRTKKFRRNKIQFENLEIYFFFFVGEKRIIKVSYIDKFIWKNSWKRISIKINWLNNRNNALISFLLLFSCTIIVFRGLIIADNIFQLKIRFKIISTNFYSTSWTCTLFLYPLFNILFLKCMETLFYYCWIDH